MLLSRRNELICQQVVELVTDYLEHSLSRTDRRRFERHLKGCPNCTNYLEQMRITIATTRRLHIDDLSPEAEQEFTELFQRWREEDGR
jgi:anti-sigma factor RsiW